MALWIVTIEPSRPVIIVVPTIANLRSALLPEEGSDRYETRRRSRMLMPASVARIDGTVHRLAQAAPRARLTHPGHGGRR
jgi:hypothetical protein